jgi:hypothetical protein
MAASASAFDVMSVPDFVAGFMYGMTGNSHLTEIESCYQGGEKVVTDSEIAFNDFKSGNWFKGIKEAGTVWNEVGSSMTTCKGMDEDIAEIEAWAGIFKQPATLSKTVAKHWLFHSKEIKADIAKEESDWSSGDYFNAGKDTADALTLAVGPIKKYGGIPTKVAAPVEFLGGVLEGLLQENDMDAVATCVKDGESLVSNVEELVSDFENGHMIRAAKLAATLKNQIPAMLGDCKTMGPQIKALEQWATAFEHPKTVAEEFAKSMLLHHKKITGDISTIKTDWHAGEYYQSGVAAADILYTVVGPVPKPTYSYTVDLMAAPELAAGFVYGMVEDNHLSEMESCYAGVQPLWQYVDAALKDIEAFHIVKALESLEKFVYHFQLDVAPCTNMGEDVAAIEQWAAAFKQPKSLVSKATKHYLLHRKAVSADIASIKNDWAGKQFFATGKVVADLLTTLVGPIE